MCLVHACIKYVVFIFNLVFLLIGTALITLGAFYLAQFTQVTDAIPTNYDKVSWIPILTVTVGCIIFLISFFGCCGAIRESPCLLTTYAVILLVIFILQVALGVFAFIELKDEKDFQNNVNKAVKEIFEKSRKGDKPAIEVVDFIQSELHCCGPENSNFWENKVPKSCYIDGNTSKQIYKDGCQTKFFQFVKDTVRIIGIVVLSLAALEVVGAVFGLCLANSVRNDGRRSQYY